MIPWILLLGTAALLGLGAIFYFYLITRVRRFSFLRRLAEKHRALSWLIAIAAVASLFLLWSVNLYAVVIAVLYTALIWLLCDLAAWIVRRIRKTEPKRYWAGAAAVALSAILLISGWIAAHRVRRTHYEVQTDRIEAPLRIALIADSHLGVTLDGAAFAKELRRIEAEQPDLLVIAGDFVDDDSEKADLVRACEALGTFSAPYGVYYVYGNHDDGYGRYRDFTPLELREALESNGVVILEDEAAQLRSDVTLIGRRDRSSKDRRSAEALLKSVGAETYNILLDHQPNDYAAEAAAGANLVLSGHTHGGHVFPAGQIGILLGANDAIYGRTVRGDTTFIITSGISGWAIPFKIGAVSEYVIIDLIPKGAKP